MHLFYLSAFSGNGYFAQKKKAIFLLKFLIFDLRAPPRQGKIKNVMDGITMLTEGVRQSYDRVGRPCKVLAALSGGADSVALLLLLKELQRECRMELAAVHVNHGLRQNAAEDERFCRQLCERYRITLIVKHVHVRRIGSLEAAAREARYAAFAEAMREAGAKVLALAHHMDDQAETVMLHLLHGAGGGGLGGMREMSGAYWRPLLFVRRVELRRALEARKQDWREDESNGDQAFARNAIRAQLMPAMERLAPQAVASLCRTSEIMQAENDCLERIAESFCAENGGKGAHCFLMAEPLRGQPLAIQRRVLRRYAASRGLLLEFAHVERLRKLLERENGAMENLPQGWRALRTCTRLHLLPLQEAEKTLNGRLIMEPFAGNPGDGQLKQAIPAMLLPETQLRTRRPGDCIQPFGMEGRQKLKDYMIARGIDRPFRDDWPLLCRGGEVLWVIGVGASQKLRLAETEKDAKLMIFSGDLPDRI